MHVTVRLSILLIPHSGRRYGRKVHRVVLGVRRREKLDEPENVDRRRIPDTTLWTYFSQLTGLFF
jgi:hypothetical protein